MRFEAFLGIKLAFSALDMCVASYLFKSAWSEFEFLLRCGWMGDQSVVMQDLTPGLHLRFGHSPVWLQGSFKTSSLFKVVGVNTFDHVRS